MAIVTAVSLAEKDKSVFELLVVRFVDTWRMLLTLLITCKATNLRILSGFEKGLGTTLTLLKMSSCRKANTGENRL